MFKSLMNTISSAWASKESKVIPLTFEEAKSRLSESEYQRLENAFQRVAVPNTHISKNGFVREVLGELFPVKIADYIYNSCGGTTKGVTFKDLVTALVLLTKGKAEEKMRFIFSIYSLDNAILHKDDFIRFIEEVEQITVPNYAIHKLFIFTHSVEYDHFRRWLMENPGVTSISAWLLGTEIPTVSNSNAPGSSYFKLTDDHETPTFYQTLAGVTHLEEEDIIELEKRYWTLHSKSKTGKMDVVTLSPLISPPLPACIVQNFIDAFDENRDGHIDFKEMACGISAAARGPPIERQKFCFKIFDCDKDGLLSKPEVADMVSVMKLVMEENIVEPPGEDVQIILSKNNQTIIEEIFSMAGTEEVMTLEEYLVWSLSNRLPEQFLTVVYQICQIILGLKPLDPQEEFQVVNSWLAREEKRGLESGHFWYLISMEWWNLWLSYVNPTPAFLSHSDSGVGSIIGSITGQAENNGGSSGRGSSSSSRCWSINNKKSNIEASVATDLVQNVVMTSMSSYGDTDPYVVSTPLSAISPQTKSSSSSLSLMTLDSSRSTTSGSPSPMNSPGSVRRVLPNGGITRFQIGKRRKPEAIDNSSLLANLPALARIPSLTNDGGRLRRDLENGKDFKIIPEALWNALHQWYGGGVPLPRQVIESEKHLEIELFPLTLLLYRHQLPNNVGKSATGTNGSATAPWTGMAGMYGASALNTTISYVQNHNLSSPKRFLAYTASFSRKEIVENVWSFLCTKLRLVNQDTRLDLLSDDLSFAVVLEEEDQTLEDLGVTDLARILIEVRNKDQTWAEEIGSLASNTGDAIRQKRASIGVGNVEKGLTGLNNLGNTCFMNSAIQCVSNTRPFTLYFMKKMHMFELNRSNPLGMKGHIAKRYGDLINEIWSGTMKTMAPFKLRWTIGKYAPRFSGFQQNDAQELLAFLLDGLHEDLNRVTEKPYVELKDSDNRPDVVCASEAWENHLLRNKSVVVDLFHGQLKSSVRCKECGHESVRFDPFNYLGLPLPMESYVFCDLLLIRSNGSVPVLYGILACVDERISGLKTRLSDLTASPDPSMRVNVDTMLFVQIHSFRVTHILNDNDRIKGTLQSRMYVFQLSGYGDEADPENRGQTTPTDHQILKILTSSKNLLATGTGSTNSSSLLRPPTDNGSRHSRQSSYSSSCGSLGSSSLDLQSCPSAENIILVVHRKMLRQEAYFVATQKSRPVLFGLPLVLYFTEGMTHLEFYKRVWGLVSRLVSPLPPPESPNMANHATDCDDSLGYEYPFVLRIVQRDAEWMCGRCPWYAFCRGCPIMCSEDERLERFSSHTTTVAIDWDPTALHLRYQTTQEFKYIEHGSVREAHKKQIESVALQSCLDSFTKKEELSEDEKYYCAKCDAHQLASKKLQIWRLPPILIVHLKRFQCMNGRWIKSHKVVEFPFHDFNPTKYLADVPRRTAELAQNPGVETDAEEESLFPLQDFHQHRLTPGTDAFDLNYRLYAVVCHSGIMGGGHYISYARNAEGKWHCFNDSSCKEVQESQIETNTVYMLFYERIGLDSEAYLPRIDPKAVPVVTDDELEAEENDLKRLCSLV